MAVITLTQMMASQIETMSWGQRRNDAASRSLFGAQVIEVAGPLWLCDFKVAALVERQGSAWKSLMLRLRGQTNQLELWDVRRPVPYGTMRGAMGLTAQGAQGASTLAISAVGQASKTLLTGDLLQLGTSVTQQVVMVTADATSDMSGNIVVNIEPQLRNTFVSGSAVTWDRPKTLFRRIESETKWDYSPRVIRGFTVSLIEDWRP